MMAHLWNEIEHDIGYKPGGGISSLTRKAFWRRSVISYARETPLSRGS